MVLEFYIRCPTCGDVIADRIEKYEDGLKKIMTNPKFNKIQKETERGKLIDELVDREKYCCRARFLGFVATADIIKE